MVQGISFKTIRLGGINILYGEIIGLIEMGGLSLAVIGGMGCFHNTK